MDKNLQDLLNQPAEQRYNYLINQVKKHQQLWILADEVGAVMFNSEQEDCIGVWPEEAMAKLWCTDDWAHCNPMAISVEKWLQDWTPGLEEDEVSILVMPDENDEGLVIEPWELAERIS